MTFNEFLIWASLFVLMYVLISILSAIFNEKIEDGSDEVGEYDLNNGHSKEVIDADES